MPEPHNKKSVDWAKSAKFDDLLRSSFGATARMSKEDPFRDKVVLINGDAHHIGSGKFMNLLESRFASQSLLPHEKESLAVILHRIAVGNSTEPVFSDTRIRALKTLVRTMPDDPLTVDAVESALSSNSWEIVKLTIREVLPQELKKQFLPNIVSLIHADDERSQKLALVELGAMGQEGKDLVLSTIVGSVNPESSARSLLWLSHLPREESPFDQPFFKDAFSRFLLHANSEVREAGYQGMLWIEPESKVSLAKDMVRDPAISIRQLGISTFTSEPLTMWRSIRVMRVIRTFPPGVERSIALQRVKEWVDNPSQRPPTLVQAYLRFAHARLLQRPSSGEDPWKPIALNSHGIKPTLISPSTRLLGRLASEVAQRSTFIGKLRKDDSTRSRSALEHRIRKFVGDLSICRAKVDPLDLDQSMTFMGNRCAQFGVPAPLLCGPFVFSNGEVTNPDGTANGGKAIPGAFAVGTEHSLTTCSIRSVWMLVHEASHASVPTKVDRSALENQEIPYRQAGWRVLSKNGILFDALEEYAACASGAEYLRTQGIFPHYDSTPVGFLLGNLVAAELAALIVEVVSKGQCTNPFGKSIATEYYFSNTTSQREAIEKFGMYVTQQWEGEKATPVLHYRVPVIEHRVQGGSDHSMRYQDIYKIQNAALDRLAMELYQESDLHTAASKFQSDVSRAHLTGNLRDMLARIKGQLGGEGLQFLAHLLPASRGDIYPILLSTWVDAVSLPPDRRIVVRRRLLQLLKEGRSKQ